MVQRDMPHIEIRQKHLVVGHSVAHHVGVLHTQTAVFAVFTACVAILHQTTKVNIVVEMLQLNGQRVVQQLLKVVALGTEQHN